MIVKLTDGEVTNPQTGQVTQRTAYIWISDGSTSYMMSVGSLPVEGALMTVLNGMESELWPQAVAGGQLPTPVETEIAGAIQWYQANAGTKAAVFDKSVAQEVTDITALIAASFPSASAAVKAGWLQLLMSSLLDTRVNAHDRGLV
jgi:hypothetical protein